MFEDQLAWYIGGPVFGACVVACRWLFNGRLGVTGGYSEIISKTSARVLDFDWRGWFAVGIVIGGAVFAIGGGPALDGYGWMTREFGGSAQIIMAALLLGSGVVIGYGAKLAGGCTSGNGLSGMSLLSPGSIVATCVFFGTAIVVANVVEAVI